MAASTTVTMHGNVAEMQRTEPMTAQAVQGRHVRRRITPEAGHALEILSHAIEYLADEYIHEGGRFNEQDPQMQAILLLMAINRKIYFACPEAPSFGDRCLSWLRFRAA